MKLNIIVAATVMVALTGCNHKDLAYVYPDAGNVRVVFDWSKAPDAAPESMDAYFFDADGNNEPVRFMFAGRDGGQIHIPYGQYSVLGLNSDQAERARFRNTEDIETFEIYTPDAENLPGQGLDSKSLPRARATEEERMAQTPTTLYSNRLDGVVLQMTEDEQTVTLTPEEVTCHYTVTVENIENMGNLDGASIDATLSGMAEGFYHGKNRPTDTPVTMPFVLTENKADKTLRGSFLTFGECEASNFPHMLVVYMVFTDGTKRYQTFDVTEQVKDAPDPRNVEIIVGGLSVPRHVDNGGGFQPHVDDWETDEIDLKM